MHKDCKGKAFSQESPLIESNKKVGSWRQKEVCCCFVLDHSRIHGVILAQGPC